jgi:disulfide bond formation protein DsbB
MQGASMPTRLTTAIRANPAAAAALVVAVVGAATMLGAYYFQYVLNMAPCPMCLEERIPYYVSIPLAVVVAIGALRGAPRGLILAGLAVIAIAMLLGAGRSVFHAGVEWKFWQGPIDCSGPISGFGSVGGLLESMEKTSVVRCDEAAWRLFGISLAGYNALISLGLAVVALWGIVAQKKA